LGGDMLGNRRSIAAANDGGRCVFEESGERHPFEQSDRYAARRKRDRFTPDMLRDYLHHFTVELFADDFLCVGPATPAVRLQQTTNTGVTPDFTLEQVVTGLPWARGR
jgi:hypothetical protein